ncbi:MAG: YdcF family protein [Candidatus Latescibacteria bacterium]|nr:YdcF family protein [Candidatus Latescibacterota bacterium]
MMSWYDRFKGVNKAIIAVVIFILLTVVLIGWTPMAQWLGQDLIEPTVLAKSDVVIVAGGEIYEDGVLSDAALRQTVHALRLVRRGFASKLIFTGTSDSDSPLSHVEAMSYLALEMGLKPDMVLVNRAAPDADHLEMLPAIFQREGWKSGLLVTSSLESARLSQALRLQGLSISAAPVPFHEKYRDSLPERLGLFQSVCAEYILLITHKWWR